MDDRAVAGGALVPRRVQPLVRTRAGSVRHRFDEDNERFRIAVQRLRSSVRELTPGARIQARPMAWLAGSLATGFVLGLLLSGGRRG